MTIGRAFLRHNRRSRRRGAFSTSAKRRKSERKSKSLLIHKQSQSKTSLLQSFSVNKESAEDLLNLKPTIPTTSASSLVPAPPDLSQLQPVKMDEPDGGAVSGLQNGLQPSGPLLPPAPSSESVAAQERGQRTRGLVRHGDQRPLHHVGRGVGGRRRGGGRGGQGGLILHYRVRILN